MSQSTPVAVGHPRNIRTPEPTAGKGISCSQFSMLSATRTIVRWGALGLAGTAAAGTLVAAAYAGTDQGAGFRREVQFWSKIFPVVADYYVHTAQSSPYVRLQSYLANDEEHDEEARKQKKRAKLDELHEKHAPDILQVMLDLKGLYIKLGQGEF